jgi:hypothetical protein
MFEQRESNVDEFDKINACCFLRSIDHSKIYQCVIISSP